MTATAGQATGGRRPPTFELVIFDNDGVLVDSESLACHILSDLLTEFGLLTTPEECVALYRGTSLASIRRRAEQYLRRTLPGDFEDRYHTRLFEAFRTS